MTPTPFNLLSDTDENDAIEDDKTPVNTKTLAEMAEAPASELFVVRAIRAAWVTRWVKRFRLRFALTMAFCLGAFFIVQAGAVWAVHSMLRDLDARTTKTVIQVLKDQKIISGILPAPTTGVAVASRYVGGSL